jgi:hypothetical protein
MEVAGTWRSRHLSATAWLPCLSMLKALLFFGRWFGCQPKLEKKKRPIPEIIVQVGKGSRAEVVVVVLVVVVVVSGVQGTWKTLRRPRLWNFNEGQDSGGSDGAGCQMSVRVPRTLPISSRWLQGF